MLISNGTDFNTDYIPYVDTGSAWVEAHLNVDSGSAFVQIPNWKAAAKRPTSAMTSNSAPSPFVALASSEYSSNYATWKAFNIDYSDAYGWAAANDDLTPWIQLKMDAALKNISVVIKNRTRASLVNGPIAGTVYGSDNGSAWTAIGSFSGRAGSTSAYVSTVACANVNDAYQYVRIALSDWAGKGDGTNQYCAIGEIEISGRYAA